MVFLVSGVEVVAEVVVAATAAQRIGRSGSEYSSSHKSSCNRRSLSDIVVVQVSIPVCRQQCDSLNGILRWILRLILRRILRNWDIWRDRYASAMM